jgi:transposase InsO family protein
MVGPAAKREAVAHLQTVMGLSERRACSIACADRKMVRYRSVRPPDGELRGRLRDLANDRRRFGYRRLFVLLRREGERSGIAAVLWEHARRSWLKRGPTHAGRLTSFMTNSPADGASGC